MGRHTTFTQEIADQICERLAAGESARKICADAGMPAQGTLYRWLAQFPEFQEQYAKARVSQAEKMADEILEIADDGTNDTYLDEEGNERLNTDVIQRSRLRVDTRKWLLSKLLPKKYGEKLELSGNKDAPLTVQVVRMSNGDDPAAS